MPKGKALRKKTAGENRLLTVPLFWILRVISAKELLINLNGEKPRLNI